MGSSDEEAKEKERELRRSEKTRRMAETAAIPQTREVSLSGRCKINIFTFVRILGMLQFQFIS